MGVVEQSHETVESYISALERSYGTFDINQSTLTVPSAEYERERENYDGFRGDERIKFPGGFVSAYDFGPDFGIGEHEL